MSKQINRCVTGYYVFLACLLFLASITLNNCQTCGQEIVWREEFDGDRIDPRIWIHDVGGHGFGNAQLEFNTARKENSYVKDGKLVIEARREKYSGREFTSARMSTQGRFAFQYGTLVARIKVPDTANGIWPAFWLLGNNFPAVNWPMCGEADILEIGSKEGIAEGNQHRKINCALHFADQTGKKKSLVQWFLAKQDLHRDYHLYQVDWTPQSMDFKLDGQSIGKWDLTKSEYREFHQPFFPILNVAIGSYKHTYTGIDTPEKVTASFPAQMSVDWIRLYANADTKVVLGNDLRTKGKFGIYTEALMPKLGFADENSSEFEYSRQARLESWNNLKVNEVFGDAAEGKRHYRFEIGEGSWFGGGVLVSNHRNMSHYSDGILHFHIRTKAANELKAGIKSSRGGESWLPIGGQDREFGFPRDGKWHEIKLPLNRFDNIDFHTVHQLFMLSGGSTSEPIRIDVDNIWWESGPKRPAPSGGSFGIYTGNPKHMTGGKFESRYDAGFYVWENTLLVDKGKPFGGNPSLRLKTNGKNWCGAAFSPNIKYDLSHFDNADSVLHFAMKTSSTKPFLIGMKSGNVDSVGQCWVEFKSGNGPFAFKRDGTWQVVEIPMSTISKEVDLTAVSQLFEFLSTDGSIEEIEFADICLIKKK